MLIIGAGGVAHVAAHKAAMHNDVLGDICIASRTESKCEAIIDSVDAQGPPSRTRPSRLHARQLDAIDVGATVGADQGDRLARSSINLGSAFVNMSVLEACIETGAAYIDTAIHEDPDKVCEDPPWYANYEWKQAGPLRRAAASPPILGAGFDPGVVNAYCALAAKKYFDTIDTIDILDVNAGSHGRYFATNFDPEINFREFVKVLDLDRPRVGRSTRPTRSSATFDFPVVGDQPVYLNGHDELHSLSKNIDANSIRFWMGFGDHYINVFTVLRTLGLLSHEPVQLAGGQRGRSRCRWSRPCCPTRRRLAPGYTGKTCIGNIVKGTKDGTPPRGVHLPGVRSRRGVRRGRSRRRISYTAGVPPVAAARADRRRPSGTPAGWSTSRSSTPCRSSASSTRWACRPTRSRSSPTPPTASTAPSATWRPRSRASVAHVAVSAADPHAAPSARS